MDLYLEAIKRFQHLLEEAHDCDLREPTAMTLATADATGKPSARTMLLKKVDEHGFVFFTNSMSRKGQQLKANDRAALLFFWQPLMQQASIEGVVELLSNEEADAYWSTRPRESQIGAWASEQSSPLESHQVLMDRVNEFKQRYEGQQVPRPSHWLGYRLVPDRIEFWKAGWGRLHERDCYEKSGDEWTMQLLNP